MNPWFVSSVISNHYRLTDGKIAHVGTSMFRQFHVVLFLSLVSGFNRSQRVLRFRPISNFAGDSPVVACGVTRYVIRKMLISFVVTLLCFFMAALKLLKIVLPVHSFLGDRVMLSHVSLHSVAEMS